MYRASWELCPQEFHKAQWLVFIFFRWWLAHLRYLMNIVCFLNMLMILPFVLLLKDSPNVHVKHMHEYFRYFMKWISDNHLSINLNKYKTSCIKKKIKCKHVFIDRRFTYKWIFKATGCDYWWKLCWSLILTPLLIEHPN